MAGYIDCNVAWAGILVSMTKRRLDQLSQGKHCIKVRIFSWQP